MPIFEYECPNCKKVFEILWRHHSTPMNWACPDCGIISPKVYSSFNFQFSPYLKELGEGNMVSY